MKKFLFAAFVVFILIVIVLVAKKVSPQPYVYSGPVESIRLGISKTSPELYILLYIAQERNFFKENGLSVTLVPYDSSVHIQQAIDEKKVDIGISGDFTFVTDNFKRENPRILTSIGEFKFLSLIYRTDRGIMSPQNLKGKKVALVARTSVEFLFNRFLLFNNLSKQDVQIVPTTVDQLKPLLENGQVDAITFSERIAREMEQESPGKFTHWSIQDDQPNYVLLAGHKDVLIQRKETFKRFLTALIKAQEYWQTNREDSLGIVKKHLSPDDITYVSSNIDNFNYKVALDQAMLLAMEDQAGWVIDNKLTDKTEVPNYLNYIYFDALEEVKPEAVTIIR